VFLDCFAAQCVYWLHIATRLLFVSKVPTLAPLFPSGQPRPILEYSDFLIHCCRSSKSTNSWQPAGSTRILEEHRRTNRSFNWFATTKSHLVWSRDCPLYFLYFLVAIIYPSFKLVFLECLECVHSTPGEYSIFWRVQLMKYCVVVTLAAKWSMNEWNGASDSAITTMTYARHPA
jgi:hypothetical protein